MRSALFFVCILFMCSCTTRSVTPTRASRRAIDTIYQQKVLVMQPHMDSACAHVHDSIYVIALDSIMTERRIEMTNLVK